LLEWPSFSYRQIWGIAQIWIKRAKKHYKAPEDLYNKKDKKK